MSFKSEMTHGLFQAMHTDANWSNHPDNAKTVYVGGHARLRGYKPRNWQRHPYGSIGVPFQDSGIQLIPMDDWKDWIKKRTDEGRTAKDVLNRTKLPCKDQDGLPYCWTYGCVGALEMTRARCNYQYVPYACECVAATIKRGAAQGGYGPDAMKFMRDKGICSEDLWPHLDRSYRKYDTPEVWADAAKTKVTFIEGDGRNIQQQVSAILQDYQVPVGLDYWSHLVYDCDVVWLDETRDPLRNIGIVFRNSWSADYGDNGLGVRRGSKMYADDFCVLQSVTPSLN